MEEILASIRRIIEDNETPKREPEFESVETAIGPAANDPARSDAFTVSRRVEAAAAGRSAAPKSEAVAVEPVVIEEPIFDMSALPVDFEDEKDDRATGTQWDVAALRSLDERVVAQPKFEAGSAPAAPSGVAPVESKPTLISDQAGRQVAASFGELSEAFAASRRRSFDEVAEEMIRPMLQDWLDNNLPVLVERLVREEIERVARGG
ncbi:MAG: PopZ family protein [Rhizobiaceae bacterium]